MNHSANFDCRFFKKSRFRKEIFIEVLDTTDYYYYYLNREPYLLDYFQRDLRRDHYANYCVVIRLRGLSLGVRNLQSSVLEVNQISSSILPGIDLNFSC